MSDHDMSDRIMQTAQQNLELLQAQVDNLYSENQAFRKRIEHLHRDRETLRTRSHHLESQLVALRNRRSHRMISLLSDLFRRKIPISELGQRLKTLSVNEADPPPLPPVTAAFSTPEPSHSDLIPNVTFSKATPNRPDLRVAAVMDPFSRAAFSYEFDYLPIHPTQWRSELTTPPDMLLVESSFVGNDGSWTNEIAGFLPPRRALRELTDWCRTNGIPTVFWNKEDPANFEWFIGAASAFDWVFTVDVDSIARYRSELGHDRIAVLPFAAQPRINYPPPADQARTGDVAFAGSYYAKKHPERRGQMEMILRPALEFGLDIFDRMGPSGDARFAWPNEYRGHLRGSLSYPQTTEAYRRYKVFLNVNTVTESPTMCARRVFELLATGTAVVSGPARALDTMVPGDAIRISHSTSETRQHLEELLSSPDVRNAMSEAGRRWIADGNTYSDRVDQILATIGLA